MSADTTGGDMSEQQPRITAQDAAGMARTALQNSGENHQLIVGDRSIADVDYWLEQQDADCVFDMIDELLEEIDQLKNGTISRKGSRLKQLRGHMRRKAGAGGKAQVTYDEVCAVLDVSAPTAYNMMHELAEQDEFRIDETREKKRLLGDFD
jgi:hypothetical protein